MGKGGDILMAEKDRKQQERDRKNNAAGKARAGIPSSEKPTNKEKTEKQGSRRNSR